MKKVLLTGATGFVGRPCIAGLLARGYDVHAVTIDPLPDLAEVQWYQADLLDGEQARRLMEQVRPSHWLHLAWYAVPGKYWASVENLRWVQASIALLQAFAQSGGRRVVMAGSCAEYDWRYGYCTEGLTPLTPATLYGTCKHALQLVLRAFAEQAHLSAAWGRIFFLYGPHEYPDRLVPAVIRAVLRGEPARCSHGGQIRDFLHVQDVADAFVALLDSDVVGPINIASGEPIGLKDVIFKIADKLHHADLIQLGVVPVPANDPPLLVADIRRLREEVKWQPKFDLDTGLEQTIEWWSREYPQPR
jgi:nucleoside-diphosphate-sugar epimerase